MAGQRLCIIIVIYLAVRDKALIRIFAEELALDRVLENTNYITPPTISGNCMPLYKKRKVVLNQTHTLYILTLRIYFKEKPVATFFVIMSVITV